MIDIDYADPEFPEPCPCCGGKTYALTRMITRFEGAYGVCHISLTETHPERTVVVISLGEWWIDDTSFRRCFTIGAKSTPGQRGFVIIDPIDDGWWDSNRLGRALTRAQALADPEIDLLWDILQQMAMEDPILAPHLKYRPNN